MGPAWITTKAAVNGWQVCTARMQQLERVFSRCVTTGEAAEVGKGMRKG
jgi:hypothetical protein